MTWSVAAIPVPRGCLVFFADSWLDAVMMCMRVGLEGRSVFRVVI